ncbi:MAG: hypothetical protein H5U17_03715 [Defluviimonas sp.]|nr:hypothetical protein [Defluviimonas sp.]
MHVLIVVSDRKLGMVWKQHLLAARCRVDLVAGQDAAVAVLERADVRVIVLDLGLAEGSAFAVADYASYRRPGAKVVSITRDALFSDGSIFQHMPNACAFLPARMPPSDLAAVVEHHCRSS